MGYQSAVGASVLLLEPSGVGRVPACALGVIQSIQRNDEGLIFCLTCWVGCRSNFTAWPSFQPSLDGMFTKISQGRNVSVFTFPEFPEWEEQYLPSLPLRNGSRKIMTEKDLLLMLSHILALSTRDQLQSLLEALLQTVTTCPEGRQVLRMEGMVENRKKS